MSRHVLFENERLCLVCGVDHALGKFLQIYDRELHKETPEGEGLVLDWSQLFGIEVNFTGQPNSYPIEDIVDTYVNENKPKDDATSFFNLKYIIKKFLKNED